MRVSIDSDSEGIPPTDGQHVLVLIFSACFALFMLGGRQSIPLISSEFGGGLFTSLRFATLLGMLWPALALRGPERVAVDAASWVALLAAVCLGWLVFRGIVAPPSLDNGEKIADASMVLGGVMATWLLALKGRGGEAAWMVLVIIGSLALCLALIAVVSPSDGGSGRIAALGGGPNIFGRIMGFLVVCGFGLVAIRWRVSGGLLVGLSGTLLLLSGSRGALFGTSCGVLALIAFSRRAWSLRRLTSTLVSGLGLLGVASVVLGQGQKVLEMTLYRVVELTFRQGYTSHRGPLVDEAIRQFASHPIVGTGLGNYQWTGAGEYPHNIVLEVAAEGGAVGVLPLLGAVVVTLLVLSAERTLTYRATLGAMWVLVLAASMFSGDIFDARALFIMPILLLAGHSWANRDPAPST